MNIVMPVIVVLETAAILWLLTVLARRLWPAALIVSHKSPRLSARYAARAVLGLRVMRARLSRVGKRASPFNSLAKAGSSGKTCETCAENTGVAEAFGVPEASQHAAPARRPFTERFRTLASERIVRRGPYASDGRSMGVQGAQAGADERESGESYFRDRFKKTAPYV